MNETDLSNYKKAGEITVKVKEFARKFIKKDMLLTEIAKRIEDEIKELGGKLAFPVNLSMDDIAAHYHPLFNDEKRAEGLLKVDFGVHIDGCIADTAISIDLTNGKYKELIEASENALNQALSLLDENPTLHEIGETIQTSVEERGFSPIVNLSGHSIEKYDVHAGITIPNYGNNSTVKLKDGVYAIEPFVTTGEGKIYEGNNGNIYILHKPRNIRSEIARRILDYIVTEKKTLPFSSRELQEKFGNMARLAIKELEQNNVIKAFPQLIEVSHKPVAQSEHTFIKHNGKIIVITR